MFISRISHIQFTNHFTLIRKYICISPLSSNNWPWIKSAQWCLCNLFVWFQYFNVCSLIVWLWILSEPDPNLCFNVKIRRKPLEFTVNNSLVYLDSFFHMKIRDISSNFCKILFKWDYMCHLLCSRSNLSRMRSVQ